VEALTRIISAFQETYPEVSFYVTYIPEDELRSRYEAASYYGGGPSLLLGPATWGWAYAQTGLVADISVYASPAFLGTINPAAVDTLRLGDQLLGLPYAQKGVVLYRNTSILPQPPDTFDELITSAQSATRGGRVGAYLERESVVSSAALYGLGGSLMDAQGNPTFNSPQGLAWLDLLARYEEAGLAGMHTNRDLILFEAGKIGYIFEGTWQLDRLTGALGPEKVALDRWPKLDSGQLSGYVQTEAVFLNTNVEQKDHQAALRFMGFLMTSEVQTLLGESGFIPTVLDASPRDVHVNMAMSALASGAAWPLVDEQILPIYWNALDEAINDVFVDGVPPDTALQSAYNVVVTRLEDLEDGD
jgi:ABC-type glycerol-3-phosphate transport system substrate-binding protein